MTKPTQRASARANDTMRKSLEDLARVLMHTGAAMMAEVTGSVVTALEEMEGAASALIADRKAQITAELSARTEGTA
ncbi:hypothetical protein [Mesorhizobium mediterraneum]|uniref:hypothetical protein n=1 Tax=Mesorhizobium mediterraneum TaxID=43617 RepID=UPI00177E1DE2|nr:hypothetical protein [Mesorhizobium mediterraneum]